MLADVYLVIGVIAGVLAVPTLLSAFSEGRAPRAAAIMVLISGGFIAVAAMKNPQGYAIEDIPQVFTRVIARYVN